MDAREYHERTKHSPQSVRASLHYLDWSNRPHPFKDYLGLEPIPLPAEVPDTGVPALEAVSADGGEARAPALAEVARILRHAAGVVRVRTFPGGDRYYFRTYACAGALYPVEVYLACGPLEGLGAGLYHYHPLEHALRRIRPGDPRPWVTRAAGGRASVAAAPATVVLSGIPWRTTWKYRARGYRHLFWDAGMILANLLALARGLAAEVVAGFSDPEANTLLGVDGRNEMAIALAPLGGGSPVAPADGPPEPVLLQARRLSPHTVEEQELLDAHAATARQEGERPAGWQRDRPGPAPRHRSGVGDGIERVIRRRGSSRVFLREPVPRDAVETTLEAATRGVPGDWGGRLVSVLAVVSAVEGLAPGGYRWDGDSLVLVAPGEVRDAAEYLCLEQPLAGDAALVCFLMADLEAAIADLGERGYRAAQLEAGIVGGRLYLGAYAHRLGASGLTFYDDEVRRFFATSLEPMLVVAIGVDGRRRLLSR